MVKGTPQKIEDCPRRGWRGGCACGCKCAACGFGKHMSIHGGVIDKPGMVFGHEFVPGGNALVARVKIDLTGGNPFPRGVPMYGTTVTLTGLTTTIAVGYAGTAPSHPVFVMTALGLTVDGTGPVVQIENLMTGEVFRYLGTIAPGSSRGTPARLDCAGFNRYKENTLVTG